MWCPYTKLSTPFYSPASLPSSPLPFPSIAPWVPPLFLRVNLSPTSPLSPSICLPVPPTHFTLFLSGYPSFTFTLSILPTLYNFTPYVSFPFVLRHSLSRYPPSSPPSASLPRPYLFSHTPHLISLCLSALLKYSELNEQWQAARALACLSAFLVEFLTDKDPRGVKTPRWLSYRAELWPCWMWITSGSSGNISLNPFCCLSSVGKMSVWKMWKQCNWHSDLMYYRYSPTADRQWLMDLRNAT